MSRLSGILSHLGRRILTVIAVVAVLGAGAWAVAQPSLQLAADCTGGYLGAPTGACGPYVPLTPTRILDTRSDLGHSGPVNAGETITLPVVGSNGVPGEGGASAVVLNVTVSSPTNFSDLIVYPGGGDLPSTSNLNFVPGETVANLVEVQLGSDGGVSFYNLAGSVQVIADLEGYVATSSYGSGLYNPVTSTRVLDTRNGTGGTTGPVAADTSISFPVAGLAGIPSSGNIEAVVFNLTATEATGNGDITAFTDEDPHTATSNLNFTAGQPAVANRVIAKVEGGQVNLYFNALNGTGTVQLIADVNGYFTSSDSNVSSGSDFNAQPPQRIADTRSGVPIGPGATVNINVAGEGGVPAIDSATPPTAVVLNVTVTDPSAASDLVVWTDGQDMPGTSDINFVAGQTQPNLVVVPLTQTGDGAGEVSFYNLAGTTDIVVDVEGWYS